VQKIGVTVWGHRVSPVFDSARNLLVAELVNGRIEDLSSLQFDPGHPMELVRLLQAQNIAVIICGAVSEGPAGMLEAAGIELIPFLAGEAREVLETYIRGTPELAKFTMPGCGRKICCRGKIRLGNELASHLPNGGKRGEYHRLTEIAADPDSGKNGSMSGRENAGKAVRHGAGTAPEEE